MSTTATTMPEPPLSEGARVINTFVAPSKTFTDIRRNASWWVPWLLISIAALAFSVVVGKRVGFDQVVQNEIQKSSRYEQFQNLPPEQRERQMQLSMKITRTVAYAPPVTTLIAFIIVAAVLLAVFNFGAGAEVTFKQALAITFYAGLPFIIYYALGIVSLMIGVDPEGFNIRNPVASNLAAWAAMDPAKNKFLYGLASGIDVFAIWSIVLNGIGYSSISKLKRSTAIVIVAIAYVVYKVIGSALGSLG